MDSTWSKLLPLPLKCPFWQRSVTLARVLLDGAIEFTHTVGGKQAFLADREHAKMFFVAWTGQRRTDLFAITDADLARVEKERPGR